MVCYGISEVVNSKREVLDIFDMTGKMLLLDLFSLNIF